MSKNLGERLKMFVSPDAILSDAREMLIRVGARRHDDSKQSFLRRAAHALGLPYGRAVSIYYRKARRIPADEFLTMKVRYTEAERAGQARMEIFDDLQSLALALRDDGQKTRPTARPVAGAMEAGIGAMQPAPAVQLDGER